MLRRLSMDERRRNTASALKLAALALLIFQVSCQPKDTRPRAVLGFLVAALVCFGVLTIARK